MAVALALAYHTSLHCYPPQRPAGVSQLWLALAYAAPALYAIAIAALSAAAGWWCWSRIEHGSRIELWCLAKIALYSAGVALILVVIDRGVRVLPLVLSLGSPLGPDLFVASAGPAIYEELLFRAGVLGGLLRSSALRARKWLAVAASALIFAAAHHVGSIAEPLEARVLAVRLLAGCVLGAVFVARGCGQAILAHAAYNLVALSLAR